MHCRLMVAVRRSMGSMAALTAAGLEHEAAAPGPAAANAPACWKKLNLVSCRQI